LEKAIMKGKNWIRLGVATLAATVLALAVGAWLYRKAGESSPQNVAAT
jgi:hypothetical protein